MGERMKVLLIDDDPNKIRQLRGFLETLFPSATVEERRSFQSGLKAALLDKPDVLLLDMTMPTYDVAGKETGGYERRYAGYEILRRLKRKRQTVPVIVVTQFERFGEGADLMTLAELSKKLVDEFGNQFVDAIFYQAADAQWRTDLQRAIEKIGIHANDGGKAK